MYNIFFLFFFVFFFFHQEWKRKKFMRKETTWAYWMMFAFLIASILVFWVFFYLQKRVITTPWYEYFTSTSLSSPFQGVHDLYWINLDRSERRRENMQKILEDSCFDAIGWKERIVAVDGKRDNIRQTIEDHYAHHQLEKKTEIEHACLLSHLQGIQKFVENHKETKTENLVALIMEDDMTLDYKPHWSERTVQTVMANAPADWEIIMLTYTGHPPEEMYSSSLMAGAGAYLIKYRAAKKFMDEKFYQKNHKFDLNKQFEFCADLYLFREFKTYVYKYPFFISSLQNDSEIHPEHLSIHNESRRTISKLIYNMEE